MSRSPEVDEYVARHPDAVRARLETLRAEVLAVAVGARERLGYGIPTYTRGKNLFHFAAYAGHIGLYPGPAAIAAHAAELTGYKTSKGTIQVPHTAPLPLALVRKLIEFNLRTLAA